MHSFIDAISIRLPNRPLARTSLPRSFCDREFLYRSSSSSKDDDVVLF